MRLITIILITTLFSCASSSQHTLEIDCFKGKVLSIKSYQSCDVISLYLIKTKDTVNVISLNSNYYENKSFGKPQDSFFESQLKKGVDYKFALQPRKFQTDKQFTNLSLIVVDRDTLYYSKRKINHSKLWYNSVNTYNSKITKDCSIFVKS